jgi:hypothetical protein
MSVEKFDGVAFEGGGQPSELIQPIFIIKYLSNIDEV